jgi:hypothetical protein
MPLSQDRFIVLLKEYSTHYEQLQSLKGFITNWLDGQIARGRANPQCKEDLALRLATQFQPWPRDRYLLEEYHFSKNATANIRRAEKARVQRAERGVPMRAIPGLPEVTGEFFGLRRVQRAPSLQEQMENYTPTAEELADIADMQRDDAAGRYGTSAAKREPEREATPEEQQEALVTGLGLGDTDETGE